MRNLFNVPRARRARGPRRRALHPACPVLEELEARSLLAAGPLGLNLSTMDFVDVMKTVRDWSPLGQSSVPRDANGWPTSDASICVFDDRVNQPWNGPDPNAVPPDISGTYYLSFHGEATVAAPSWDYPLVTMQNQTYDPRTNTTTADVVVPEGQEFVILDFTDTQRTPDSPTNTGITDVKLIQPGYDPGTTQLFTNNLLNALKPFGTLRFMDAEGINNYPVSVGNQLNILNWSQRRLPSDSSQADMYGGKIGVAWEYVIQLANQTNTDLWINIPGPATDDYITQLAKLIRDGDTVNGVSYPGLKPGLKVYLEYSNEVWGGIPQNRDYNIQAAQQEVAAGNSTLNNDGNTDPYTWGGRRYLERTMQITNIFRSVFGPDPTYSTIRPVLGWQEVNYGQYYLDTFPWFESTYGAPNQYFYGLGGTNYFDPTDYSSVDAIINSLTAGEAAAYTTTKDFTTIANYYGLKNVAYEGGPAISATGSAGQNGLAALRDPRMEDIVKNYYLDWYAAGGDLAMYYAGPYGIWGPQWPWAAAEQSQAANPSLSPKYRGLQDVANNSPVASAIRSPGDAGFERPNAGPAGAYGSFLYNPTGSAWTFAGSAGVAANGSGFTAGNPAAPEGAQVAFVQATGSFSQSVGGWQAGSYRLSFQAAQRGNYQLGGYHDFDVLVDDVVVATIRPADTTYRLYTTGPFKVAAGTHTITFRGRNSAGGDNTSFLDDIRIQPA
jgi:hypothetical protein